MTDDQAGQKLGLWLSDGESARRLEEHVAARFGGWFLVAMGTHDFTVLHRAGETPPLPTEWEGYPVLAVVGNPSPDHLRRWQERTGGHGEDGS